MILAVWLVWIQVQVAHGGVWTSRQGPSCKTDAVRPAHPPFTCTVIYPGSSGSGVVWTMNGTTLGTGDVLDLSYCPTGCLDVCSGGECAAIELDCGLEDSDGR